MDVLDKHNAIEAAARSLIEGDPAYFRDFKALFFGLVGFVFQRDTYDIRTNEGKLVATIRKVANPPNVFILARVLKPKTIYGAIDRYASVVSYELALPLADGDVQHTVDKAYEVIAFLRVAGAAEGIVPAALHRSWSALAAITDNSCEAYLIEDFPKARRYRNPPPIDDEVVSDLGKHLDVFAKLYKEEGFKLAVQSYCAYGQSQNERMAASTLWSGIEALFDIESELRFRLALYISFVSPDKKDNRFDYFKKVQKLYDQRSKIVHGKPIKEKEIYNHLVEVSVLLCRLLMTFVINGRVFSRNEIDKMILSADEIKLTLKLPISISKAKNSKTGKS